MLGLISWLVAGVIMGILARVMMKGEHRTAGDVAAGIVGALLGGGLFAVMPGRDDAINKLDINSIYIACVGAYLVIALLRAVGRRRSV